MTEYTVDLHTLSTSFAITTVACMAGALGLRVVVAAVTRALLPIPSPEGRFFDLARVTRFTTAWLYVIPSIIAGLAVGGLYSGVPDIDPGLPGPSLRLLAQISATILVVAATFGGYAQGRVSLERLQSTK
jgi:hypothetical protein